MDAQTFQSAALGVVSIICTASVPWAFTMERRLSRIEARLSNGILGRVDKLEERLARQSDLITQLRVDNNHNGNNG